jgi:hypothetical protein
LINHTLFLGAAGILGTKKKQPVGYFLTETLPDSIDKFISDIIKPFNSVRYYIKNRFIYKTHYLHTRLKPGQWYDFDYRLMHGIMGEFVDYVEIEYARFETLFVEDKQTLKHMKCGIKQ